MGIRHSINFTGEPPVGREDRLVRAGIALSLLLMAGFSIFSGGVGIISVIFALLGTYFVVTAALGRDPIYAHFGVDTHARHEAAAVRHTVLDLRSVQRASSGDPRA